MTENIIIALCGLLGTFFGAYFANRKSSALIEFRLKSLEQKVQAHNNLVERMYEAEKDIAVLQDDISDLKK